MTRHSWVRSSFAAIVASWLVPSIAHASGGWEGITTLVGALAIPVIVLLLIGEVIMIATKKGGRVGAILSLIAGLLSGVWQLFWYSLDSGGDTGALRFVGILLNLVAVGLAIRLLRAQSASAAPAGQLHAPTYPQQPGYPPQQGYPQQGYPQQGYPQQGYPQQPPRS